MPSVGRRCHELRIQDESTTWRVMYRVDPDAVVILTVFSKKTEKTPAFVIAVCRARLKAYSEQVRKK